MPKAFWDKPNPKKKSKPLTASQKSAAKRRAKAAGNRKGKQFVAQPKKVAKKTARYR